MRRPQPVILALTASLVGMVLSASCRAGEEETRKDFERLAGQFQFFCGGDFLYDRPPVDCVPADMLPKYQKLLDEVTAPQQETPALLALLKHKDPRVRTLAIAALYAKEDPKVLPGLVEMIGDAAATLPEPQPFEGLDLERNKLPPLEERKVGRLAKAIVESYMEHAGVFDGISTPDEAPGFDTYWAARRGREFCGSWYKVQLDRATQGIFPTPEARVKRVRAVWERIDRLPKLDRAWTLFWLRNYAGVIDVIPSDDELIAAGNDLGPDRLVAMLRRQIPRDDPDLQPRPSNNTDYKSLQVYVLCLAPKLLRPEDAPALLECERDEWEYKRHGISDPLLTSSWPIGAASLQPEHAKDWLHDAMKRYSGEYDASNRAAIAVALWSLIGPPETQFIVTWFYEQKPEMATFPHCRAQFLEAVSAERGRAGRRLIASILQDKRFEGFNDWQSLTTLIEIVNAWVDKPVVDKSVVKRTQHPFGVERYYWWQDRARKEYPKETEELEKTFGDWRNALRESIPKWGE